jgi:3-oxoacyl-[acyl-carrier protein] reductase
MSSTQAKRFGASSKGIPLSSSLASYTAAGFVRMDGQSIVVTGGSGGLGAVVARRLARHGAAVAVVGRNAARLRSIADEIGPNALGLALDVSHEPDMERMARAALDRWGRIDALVACAGIARASGAGSIPQPVHTMSVAEWDEVMATNLRGTFLSNRAVLPHMMGRRGGKIVNVASSPAGISGQPFAAAYCASKSAAVGLSEALASECSASGVRVHCVFPDLIDTPLIRRTTLAAVRGRPMDPERVAAFIHHLLNLPADVDLVASRASGRPTVLRSLSGPAASVHRPGAAT